MEYLKLNNGVELPALGLGVFQPSPQDTHGAVAAALAAGYRHVDTAAAYGNERQVGEAVRASNLERSKVGTGRSVEAVADREAFKVLIRP